MSRPRKEDTKSFPWKAGDWECPKCGDHQFARNTICRKCNTERPQGAGPKSTHRSRSRNGRKDNRSYQSWSYWHEAEWKEYTEEEWDKWAAEQVGKNEGSGWTVEQWKEYGKQQHNEQWETTKVDDAKQNSSDGGYSAEEWAAYNEEQEAEKKQNDQGAKGKEKGKGKGKEKGKGKGKGKRKGKPAPERLDGKNWEQPKEAVDLTLLGEKGPEDTEWHYPLVDHSRRSYAGFLPSPLSEAAQISFFERIKAGTDWVQPQGKIGLIPRLAT